MHLNDVYTTWDVYRIWDYIELCDKWFSWLIANRFLFECITIFYDGTNNDLVLFIIGTTRILKDTIPYLRILSIIIR